jgi:protein O-GlcNAc transferase
VATSLLQAVGLPELSKVSLADYVATAMHLARTPSELSALKAHLEGGRLTFPLFDTAGYCGQLEAVYEEVWARHARGEPPSLLDMRQGA